jgi:hypothetical protein
MKCKKCNKEMQIVNSPDLKMDDRKYFINRVWHSDFNFLICLNCGIVIQNGEQKTKG